MASDEHSVRRTYPKIWIICDAIVPRVKATTLNLERVQDAETAFLSGTAKLVDLHHEVGNVRRWSKTSCSHGDGFIPDRVAASTYSL